ncbi:MAG: hypothetical protein DMG43_03645 [Acidobacteria bacterium]|nr:MAG: hypothetical protein DMG43_03645 [Acidobacteriota bacterium]
MPYERRKLPEVGEVLRKIVESLAKSIRTPVTKKSKRQGWERMGKVSEIVSAKREIWNRFEFAPLAQDGVPLQLARN